MAPPDIIEAPTPGKQLMAFIGLGVGVVLGGALFALGGLEVTNEVRLRMGSSTVLAQVTDTRVMEGGRSGTSYQVRYRFTLKGSDTPYTRRDETGRANLWASLPEELWSEARASRKVRVVFLPEDPWVNRPTEFGAMPLGDPLAGACLGLSIGAPCLLILLGMIRGAVRSLRRRNEDAEPS